MGAIWDALLSFKAQNGHDEAGLNAVIDGRPSLFGVGQ